MRVLMLTNMYPHEADPSFGTFVYEQVRALRALGVDIDVLFVNGRASRWNYLLGYLRFWRQLYYVRYDLIHAHYVFSGLIARAQVGLPIVQSFHAPGQMHTYQGWLCKRLAPWVDEIIVTSAQHKALLGHERAHIIPCGVDLELFKPRPRDEARAELGWDVGRKIVAWVGDPRREKRLDLAYATYELLRRRREDVELKVVSKVPHEAIPTYLNAADVLLLTSDHEGSPVVIKEAMACNLPIVSTAVGDVPEVIGGVEGCFLAEHTPEDLADKVERALAFGRRTRGREAIAHLQTQEEARKILALYEGVLARRRAKAGRKRVLG
jgi:teichuronic acid biosynthesis glycosyltransferase TuaC